MKGLPFSIAAINSRQLFALALALKHADCPLESKLAEELSELASAKTLPSLMDELLDCLQNVLLERPGVPPLHEDHTATLQAVRIVLDSLDLKEICRYASATPWKRRRTERLILKHGLGLWIYKQSLRGRWVEKEPLEVICRRFLDVRAPKEVFTVGRSLPEIWDSTRHQ